MTSLQVHSLSDDVSVAGQLVPADMARAAQAGFRSVINNRPDFEGGPDQPTNADIEAAARAAGVAYAYLPVGSAYQSPQEIERFAELLAHMDKPILAFCRSGTRSSRLYAQAQAMLR